MSQYPFARKGEKTLRGEAQTQARWEREKKKTWGIIKGEKTAAVAATAGIIITCRPKVFFKNERKIGSNKLKKKKSKTQERTE